MTTKLQRAVEIHETMAAIHAHPKPAKESKELFRKNGVEA